ncbi:MAG: Glycosyl transferase family 1 [Candidatus Wolfebacteria bacterium GW2011_GWB1_41_12]|uniref:Glycosyl transferase family 1 n=1 Tax=Candidatus Wolfebacteria bacterium GW2011_GWB1_41_12 TaxID=1619006 RepID=A0A0G0UMI6_9BACT|nr:MAG: Glycosyl transferase family 1 [Candidatus Wolfebacteria bacterium GW2011_GWB1_41_12]
MAKLLMITGLGSAKDLASGKKGAFYNTLEEFHKYWDRIDIIVPRIKNYESRTTNLFGNVFIHISPWPFDLMTVQEFPPFYNGIGARLLWHKIKVPYILEIHHIPGYPRAASFKEALYRNLIKWFIKFDASKAAAIRVVNHNQTPGFLKRAGVPLDKIIYISSIYIDLAIFKPMNLEKEHDIIFVGRLEKNKGIKLLLEAIIHLKLRNLNFKTLVVGDGPLRKEIASKIKKWDLNIDLYGWAGDSKKIAELINKSKILVMPSYNEGGPRVVVEALACGLPILATAVGIVPDLLKNGQGGEIIAWNEQDISNKAAELLGNEDKRKQLGRAGIEIAKSFERKEAVKNYAEKLKLML